MSFSETQPPCYSNAPFPPPPPPRQGFSSKFGGCLVGCACGCLFSLLFPFLLVVVLSAFSCTRLLNDSPQTLLSDCTSAPQEILREGAGKRAIAVIPVQGVIGFHSGGNSFLDSPRPGDANRIVQALQQVADSPERYGAVILDMNTPGGEVVASDAVRRQLDRLPQEIPVVTCMVSDTSPLMACRSFMLSSVLELNTLLLSVRCVLVAASSSADALSFSEMEVSLDPAENMFCDRDCTLTKTFSTSFSFSSTS